MKRAILICLCMVLFVCGSANAFWFATSVNNTSGGTHSVVKPGSGGLYVDHVIVSNNETTPRYIHFYDSPTYKFSVALDSNSMKRLPVKCRFTSQLAAYCSGNEISITAAYESGTYGHYMYGVAQTTTQDTVYNNPGDAIGLIVANWGHTGYHATFQDSGTNVIRVSVPKYSTEYVDCDRIRIKGKFQLQLENGNMAVAVIRRK